MGTLITSEYLDILRSEFSKDPSFGTSGGKYVAYVADLYQSGGFKSVLDYGCGQGLFAKGFLQLFPNCDLQEYDPAITGKDIEPHPADIVLCSDVLEHVEPDCLVNVLKHIASKTITLCVFGIASRPAKRTLCDGRNAHLIIENCDWWTNTLSESFNIVRQVGNEHFALMLAIPLGNEKA